MKTLSQLRNESTDKYEPAPKAQGEKDFASKHFGADGRPVMAPGHEGSKDRNGNDVEQVYRGTVVKTAGRPGHGFAAAPSKEDEAVYEGKTWRREKTEKGGSIKKFLSKKKQKDEKRLHAEEVQPIEEAIKPKGDSAMPTDVGGIYQAHHDDCKNLLKQIGAALDDHHKKATKKTAVITRTDKGVKEVKKPVTHWGHVGDLKHHRSQLENMRDQLTQQGEYANPTYSDGTPVRHEDTLVTALGQQFAETVRGSLEKLEGETKEMVEQLIADENWEDLTSLYTESD